VDLPAEGIIGQRQAASEADLRQVMLRSGEPATSVTMATLRCANPANEAPASRKPQLISRDASSAALERCLCTAVEIARINSRWFGFLGAAPHRGTLFLGCLYFPLLSTLIQNII
jgi:hypothetical protein